MRRAAIAAALVAPIALAAAVAAFVHAWARIDVPPRLDADGRRAVIAALRAGLDGAPHQSAAAPALARRLDGRGPVVVTAFAGGRRTARVIEHGDTLGAAVERAAAALAAHPAVAPLSPAERSALRLQVDVVAGRGPLLRRPALLAPLALHPGLEGIGVTLDGEREVVLTPADLIAERLLVAARPIPFIPDFQFGFDFARAEMALAVEAALPAGSFGAAERRYWRFRTDSFVEAPPGQGDAPLPLTRGVPPGPAPSPAVLREAALAGGRYLVAHMAPNGRYVYETDLATGASSNPAAGGPYSLPRHAGTTYFLAELYRLSGDETLREPIERAAGHLVELVRAGGCEGALESGAPYACVVDRGQRTAALGSTALAVVALAEYRRATGDHRYDELARALTEWILWMQRADGSFHHRYDVASGERDPDAELLYFSGEAALALARVHAVYGDERALAGAKRALDWLTGWYDFFGGGFFYGEEHWTCIAAEAAYPALDDPRYLDFCLGYGEFLRRHQLRPGEFSDQDDLAGSYGFTPFFPPQNTPAGSRTEAMISTYELALHHGRQPDPALREQIELALAYSLRQQVRPESLWNVPEDARGLGGVPASPVDRKVRIDYVQHLCSPMIRWAALED